MPDATDRARPRSSDRAKGRSVPFLGGAGTTLGPGAENLQLLLDYEDWQAGDPLPSVYPDNSGIQSLTDNNSVQEETASPLVGTKSGFYERSNNEWHGGVTSSALDIGPSTDIYVATFLTIAQDLTANRTIFSTIDGNTKGFIVRIASSENLNILVAEGGSFGSLTSSSFGSISIGTKTFVEAWYTSSGDTLHVRIEDGTEDTASVGSAASGSGPLGVGDRADSPGASYGGLLDQFIVEIAPQGELFWPSESTFLYNGGAGRTADEILAYSP